VNDLGRLLYAWRMYRREGLLPSDALKFKLLLEEALDKGDDKFLGALTAEVQRQNSRAILRPNGDGSFYSDPEAAPYFPETALKKVRQAYVALTFEKFREAYKASIPEMELPAWSDVKEKAIDLYGLKLTDRQWRRLRVDARLSELPNPPRGKAKKRGHRK
jgi:hypothetical protein